MSIQSPTQTTREVPQQHFDIHKKLKKCGRGLSYMYQPHPTHEGKEYILITCWGEAFEYALYKRMGNYFLLVDFFTDFNSACDEAKIIIRSIGKYSRVFGSDGDANQTPEPNPNKPVKI